MESNYEIDKPCGAGSFGQVYKARRRCDGAIVAYKVMKKKGRDKAELESLQRECEIQKTLHHPNIIQMLDSFETDNKIVVITEFVEKELSVILERAGRFSEERAQVIACDLVSALHYLHSNRIVHRDMKPQNVLLDTTGVAKLCDFGFAKFMSYGTHVMMSVKGTPLYMAPELIDERPYDHNVDLWSLGCIIYELVNGTPPFYTKSLKLLLDIIRTQEIKWPEHVSENCLSFLQGLLQKEPEKRLTWPDLLEHPFVKGRILTVDESAPRSLTSPLSASQARAKQQQLQSLASRFTSQSKKMLEKQIKKIHSQVLRKSEPSGSESGTSVDVLLNNLSLRASLRSDLVAADHAICQVECPIAEEDFSQLDNAEATADHALVQAPCCLAALQQQQMNLNAAAVAAWQLDNANVAVALPVCCLMQNKSCCMSGGLHNDNNSISYCSGSLDEFNNECKQTTTSSRLSSVNDKQIARDVNNIIERRARIPDWIPRDSDQLIENEEWLVFLERSMEEIMDGDITSFVQENCMSVFVGPLKNPEANCRVVEYIACLLSLPYAVDSVSPDDLERIQRVYLDVRVVPNCVYAVKLLMSERCGAETDASSSIAANKWRTSHALSADELQALESTLLVLCRLVHAKQEFLRQFCDAVFVVPDGIVLFQHLLELEKRKARLVSDFIAIMCQVLRSETSNVELVDEILLKQKSSDHCKDLFTKLLSHRQSKLKIRVCAFLLLLGQFSRRTLQRIWCNSLRNSLEDLIEDREKCVQDAATEAVATLKQLPFYNQENDTWSMIET